MRNLNLVSFVGVDEKTDLNELTKLSNSFAGLGMVEWSVLFSDSKSVGNYARYPSYKFCKEFLEYSASTNYVHSSIHLCGSVIERYLKQEKDVMELCAQAQRIQLNINIDKFPGYEKLINDLIVVLTNHKHTIVMQQNKTKANFNLSFLKTLPSSLYGNVNLLHDGSGGFGREITQVEAPSAYHYTGYAGGIKPENAAKIVELIEKVNINNKPYYIDMESGVREDNIFSLQKCQQVMTNLGY